MTIRYTTLGRSGLGVSPLCLGAMTFGTAWGYGASPEESKAMLHRFLDWGGNFVDTADLYTNGESETILGDLMSSSGLRERLVVSTKFSLTTNPTPNVNGGGNGRKHAYAALDGSLRRLKTDYVDVYWLHCWDGVTPVEEVVETFHAMIQAGKVRYYAMSDVPTWYAARAFSHAERHGLARPIALQLEYSLLERSIEREHIPMAQTLGFGLTPWSPLAGGFLTGKYKQHEDADRNSRVAKTNNLDRLNNERAWNILGELTVLASELGQSPSTVALAWVYGAPGVTSTLIGARNVEQLNANLAAFSFDLPLEARQRLDAVSAPELIHPYKLFQNSARFTAGAELDAWKGFDPFAHRTAGPGYAATLNKTAKKP